MKRIYTISLILFIFPIISFGANGYTHSKALSFYNEIIKTDPLNHDLVEIRKYRIEDINNNKELEILVYKNELNEEAEGLLNVELYPALEWVDIYSFQNGRYIKSNAKYKWFLTKRMAHYQLWLRTIKNPTILNEDSQSLLKTKYKNIILKKIKQYLNEINKMRKE